MLIYLIAVSNQLLLVSGHSSRLSVSPFPSISDSELAKQLGQLAIKVVKDEQEALKLKDETPLQTIRHIVTTSAPYRWMFKDRELPADDIFYVFPKPAKDVKGAEDAKDAKDAPQYIVKRLDSHMGDTIKSLRAVIEDGKAVEGLSNVCCWLFIYLLSVAVDEVIKDAEPTLIDALLGDSRGKVDRLTYIATAHLVYEALSKDVKVVHWDSIVREGAPRISNAELSSAIAQLVKNNLLSYVDKLHVGLHSRRLKWAYQNVCKDTAVTIRVKEALIAFK